MAKSALFDLSFETFEAKTFYKLTVTASPKLEPNETSTHDLHRVQCNASIALLGFQSNFLYVLEGLWQYKIDIKRPFEVRIVTK